MNSEEYIARVPWQHRHKPKFQATLRALIEPLARLGTLMEQTPEAYDLWQARGRQLDVVGEWVGCSRYIDTPLEDIYFTWAGPAKVGWAAGQWKGRYDPSSGLVALDDDTYRTLIMLQIAANSWDGTVDKAYASWTASFPDAGMVIEDHQNMTITIGISGKMQGAAQRAIFSQQISPFKPAGVGIDVYFITTVDAPLFAWGIKSRELDGWGTGAWAEKFLTN